MGWADIDSIKGVSATEILQRRLREAGLHGFEVSWDPSIKMVVVKATMEHPKVKNTLDKYMALFQTERSSLGPIYKDRVPYYYVPYYDSDRRPGTAPA